MIATPKVNSTYRKFAELQFAHHNLLADGKDESPEAEDLEDRLSALWNDLDDAQRKSLNGMGSDLNWLRSRGIAPAKGRKAGEVTAEELAELDYAQRTMDWLSILHHLRVCAPALPPDVLAYSRATCYFKLNFPNLSVLFADLAVELSRQDSAVARFAFEALIRLAPQVAFHRANEVLSSASVYSPTLVVQSVGFVFDFLSASSVALDTVKLVEYIRDARRRLDVSRLSQSDLELFFQLAGSAMHAFRHEDESRQLFQEGLSIAPENPSILAGLGTALYDSESTKAADLFQRAIIHKASFLSPYLFLAHHNLLIGEFEKAYDYAKQALVYANDDRARAGVLEIMGISALETKKPRGEVLSFFEEAARLAPESTRIASNLKVLREGRNDTANLEYQKDRTVPSMSELPLTPMAKGTPWKIPPVLRNGALMRQAVVSGSV